MGAACVGLPVCDLSAHAMVKCEEAAQWQRAMAAKWTLAAYRQHKKEISAVDFYDNALGSKLLSEARAGAFSTLVRQRRISDEVPSVVCRACGKAKETIDHVVLLCDAIGAPAVEDITIGAALGFELPGIVGDPDCAVDKTLVARTKGRLERWRAESSQVLTAYVGQSAHV
ncbi:hypothetical protein HPB49_004186 [Dermacentor silvarum]|uniref:Uncharacterized protein n=1 Tax=Dermacentor silvarum TaxID=543639 RepID=A0ACB8C225_DERSI|nr:hypothetical protein HPB49_004186 [Dermacentor silvarum]